MKMSTLALMREKYKFNGGNYDPNPQCKFCNGAGERLVKTDPPRMTFCICLYVAPDMSDFAGEMLGRTAKSIRKEMSCEE